MIRSTLEGIAYPQVPTMHSIRRDVCDCVFGTVQFVTLIHFNDSLSPAF